MKLFVDLGAYEGQTVKEFNNWIRLIDEPNAYDIWAFEPNPDLEQQNIINARKNGYNFEPSAAWIYDGEIEMAIDKTDTPMGSTIMPSKTDIWDHYPKVKVKCFDFSKWLKDKSKEYNWIIVKMDCEGAEFEILNKMIDDKTISIPDYLLVEFHENKVRQYSGKDRENLIYRIGLNGGNYIKWH